MEWQHVIITGASSGLGEEFARQLAGQCRQMTLVARRKEKLDRLAARLMEEHPGLAVDAVACDLSEEAGRQGFLQAWEGKAEGRLLLVNNAGLGDYGDFPSSDPTRNRQIMQVNMSALADLCRAMLPTMLRHGGGIINIASLAADLAIPDFALYAASKAFVASFSEALRLELKDSGIHVTAVCPGPIHTGFGETARRPGWSGNETPFREYFYTSMETVAKEALHALRRNKARCYPSLKIRLSGLLIRNLPLCLLRRIMGSRPRKIQQLPSTREQ